MITRTCFECGATTVSQGHTCPLCGNDRRHDTVLAAILAAGRRWESESEMATRILAALDAAELAARESEDDDA